MKSTSMYWADYLEAKAEGRTKTFEKYIRCGSDCVCNHGQGHGPYRYARFWNRGGRTCRTVYLGKSRNPHKIRRDKVLRGIKAILGAVSQ